MAKSIFLGFPFTVACAWLAWWAWMGWDTEMTVDPVTGNQTGPYEAWQVIGSALCVAALVIAATLVWGPLVAAAATTVGYTSGWMVTAFGEDEQGLAIVGGGLVLIGVAASSTLVAALTCRVTASGRR